MYYICYTNTHMHACIHTDKHIYTHTYTHACIYMCPCIHSHKYIQTHTHTHAYTCPHSRHLSTNCSTTKTWVEHLAKLLCSAENCFSRSSQPEPCKWPRPIRILTKNAGSISEQALAQCYLKLFVIKSELRLRLRLK